MPKRKKQREPQLEKPPPLATGNQVLLLGKRNLVDSEMNTRTLAHWKVLTIATLRLMGMRKTPFSCVWRFNFPRNCFFTTSAFFFLGLEIDFPFPHSHPYSPTPPATFFLPPPLPSHSHTHTDPPTQQFSLNRCFH